MSGTNELKYERKFERFTLNKDPFKNFVMARTFLLDQAFRNETYLL